MWTLSVYQPGHKIWRLEISNDERDAIENAITISPLDGTSRLTIKCNGALLSFVPTKETIISISPA